MVVRVVVVVVKMIPVRVVVVVVVRMIPVRVRGRGW